MGHCTSYLATLAQSHCRAALLPLPWTQKSGSLNAVQFEVCNVLLSCSYCIYTLSSKMPATCFMYRRLGSDIVCWQPLLGLPQCPAKIADLTRYIDWGIIKNCHNDNVRGVTLATLLSAIRIATVACKVPCMIFSKQKCCKFLTKDLVTSAIYTVGTGGGDSARYSNKFYLHVS